MAWNLNSQRKINYYKFGLLFSSWWVVDRDSKIHWAYKILYIHIKRDKYNFIPSCLWYYKITNLNCLYKNILFWYITVFQVYVCGQEYISAKTPKSEFSSFLWEETSRSVIYHLYFNVFYIFVNSKTVSLVTIYIYEILKLYNSGHW